MSGDGELCEKLAIIQNRRELPQIGADPTPLNAQAENNPLSVILATLLNIHA